MPVSTQASPALTGLPSAAPTGLPSPAPTGLPSPAPTAAISYQVSTGGESDVYHYAPTTLTVPAGVPVEIRFVDQDVLDHTWTVFDADGTTVLAELVVAKEGDVATGVFTFTKPGTYRFWCTRTGHRGFGEQGTLVVTP